ncbi:MAG: methenyltetrahydromethanopterin cyclohydrolase [Candidatus Odinarchaeota archaeon]
MELHLNEKAWKLFEMLLQDPDTYNVGLLLLGGTKIVDCISMSGSDDAGILVSKITLGGYGDIELMGTQAIGELEVEMMKVTLDEFPYIPTLGSQFAGWRINKKYTKVKNDKPVKKTYFAMASGPARALKDVLEPKEIYKHIDYKENYTKTVVLLETNKIPVDEILTYIYHKCNVLPENLGVICAPTNCRVGSLQIAARVVETAISKFHEIGLDVKNIVSSTGTTPIAPIASDPLVAMGCTNDCIVFAGDVQLTVKGMTDETLEEAVDKIPSSSSPDYGKPFFEIFKEADFDFYKIDPGFFAPAKINLVNADTGNTFTAGEVNPEVLEKSFKMANG